MNKDLKLQRSWSDLKAAKRLKVSLNPIRNWAEFVRPENEKLYQERHDKEGFNRPDPQLTFLMGDPTRYPSFGTPVEFKIAACDAVGVIDGYTDFFGDKKVRQQIAEKLSTTKLSLSSEDVILTHGGSLALFYCIYAMCNKGDKILVAKPSFPLMHAFAAFLEVEILWYNLEGLEWQPNFQEIENHLTKHQNIKFILINSPSNPLGSIMNKGSILHLMRTCEKYNNLPIVCDEIYELMTYPGEEFKFLSEYSTTVPVLSCSGLTKRCLVPGWRLGWLVFYGLPGVFDEIKKALRGLTNILLMPNTICQVAANQVYRASDNFLPKIMSNMADRFLVIKNSLSEVQGISVGVTSGAMYSTIILDCSKFLDIADSQEFAIKLQIEENVLLFPGELFQGKDFLRFVICADQDILELACKRIKTFSIRHLKQ